MTTSRRKRNPLASAADADVGVAQQPQTVEEPTFDDAIPRMLSQLPDRQRTAMALFYIDGLSVEQTADAMGLSTGAVKFHLNKGRAKLRPLLENRAGDDD